MYLEGPHDYNIFLWECAFFVPQSQGKALSHYRFNGDTIRCFKEMNIYWLQQMEILDTIAGWVITYVPNRMLLKSKSRE